MSKKPTRAPSTAPSLSITGENGAAQLALRMLQQAVVVLLAVLGFLFSLLSCYQLDLPVSILVWTAVAFSLLSLAVFSIRRRGLAALLCLLAALFWIVLNASDLLQGILLLFEQAITPINLVLPETLQSLLLPVDMTTSQLLMTRAMQLILFFVAFLSSFFIIDQPSLPGLALTTLPMLAPGPFYLLAPDIVPFFALITALLMVLVFNNGKRAASNQRAGVYVPQTKRRSELNAQRSAQQVLSLLALPLILLAAMLSSLVLPQNGYERPEAIEET